MGRRLRYLIVLGTTLGATLAAIAGLTFGQLMADSDSETVLVAGRPADADNGTSQPNGAATISPDLTIPTPNAVSGIDFSGGEILMVSEQAAILYVLDPSDGSVIRSVNLPSFGDSDLGGWGIAAASGFWWHADYQRLKLYKLNPADGSVLLELPMPSMYLGIAWDGTNVWGVSPNTEELYRIDPATGSILNTYSLSATDGPIGGTWDGTFLWVSERDGDKFHKIDLTGNVLHTEDTAVPTLGGIAPQAPHLWVDKLVIQEIMRFDMSLGPPPMCNGQPATLIGTDGNDILLGTPGNDVIVGLKGNDVIIGKDGGDVICAGPGTDGVLVGPGNDWDIR